jgi:hypothetical protein
LLQSDSPNPLPARPEAAEPRSESIECAGCDLRVLASVLGSRQTARWDAIEGEKYLLKVFAGYTRTMIAYLNYGSGKSRSTLLAYRDFYISSGVYIRVRRIRQKPP